MKKNKHIGSSVEAFLIEEGTLDTATARAVKTVIAWQLTEEMKKQKITKTAFARMLGTSRTQLYRILDPVYNSVTIATLEAAAALLGKRLVVELR
ncbi:MAG: helix-turn-helix domain-containing protein [Hyphomicrobiaceae bacterium]